MKKSPTKLQREIDAALAQGAWHKGVLSQVERWVEVNKDDLGSWAQHRSTVIDRLSKLETFLHVFFPGKPEGFLVSIGDAAAMIVLPVNQALQLARAYFGGGPGIAKDLAAEDLSWNMDWFRPRGFR